MWLPPPLHQDRGELFPADPKFLIFDYTFINNSDLLQDIFLGMDPYTNNELTHLSLVCTCFTDVAYWQLTHAFKIRPREKSQL